MPKTFDGTCCRGTAWSPIRSAQSLAKFFVITAGATTTAWHAHPQLLNLAAHVLHLDFKDSVTAFQTSFFSFLSLVFAIYSGNTMAFLYDVSWKGQGRKAQKKYIPFGVPCTHRELVEICSCSALKPGPTQPAAALPCNMLPCPPNMLLCPAKKGPALYSSVFVQAPPVSSCRVLE